MGGESYPDRHSVASQKEQCQGQNAGQLGWPQKEGGGPSLSAWSSFSGTFGEPNSWV